LIFALTLIPFWILDFRFWINILNLLSGRGIWAKVFLNKKEMTVEYRASTRAE
jgi:hypothetical protein